MESFVNGKSIFVRGRIIAHAMIAVLRPCNVIEDEEAIENIEREEREEKISDGKLQLKEGRSAKTFQLVDTSTAADGKSLQNSSVLLAEAERMDKVSGN